MDKMKVDDHTILEVAIKKEESISCQSGISRRFSVTPVNPGDTLHITGKRSSYKEMKWIEGGVFMMRGDNKQANPDEFPKHKVIVSGFWMDEHEVRNAQFQKFVEATNYITMAEHKLNWDKIKKHLPSDTPKPTDKQLIASSLVFTPPKQAVQLNDYSQWWSWMPGAEWKHPDGPKSIIKGKENFLVIHILWDDTIAYSHWAGKRLPTEVEWEFAARGGLENNIYPWGIEHIDAGKPKVNSWQGNFPNYNSIKDGYYGLSAVKSFSPNKYGLYDMAGNVWEWCSDWYSYDYYKAITKSDGIKNPQGPSTSFDPQELYAAKKVIRRRSFMYGDSYCS